MEPETMRSITAWLLLASVHQEPVPSQVTAAGSCAHVTRPGTTPRGTPSGESVGSNKEEPMLLAAAIERANCRRVISIFGYSLRIRNLRCLVLDIMLEPPKRGLFTAQRLSLALVNRGTTNGEPLHYFLRDSSSY